MTANQRRPGFRLPWSSETDEPTADGAPAASAEEATSPAPAEPAPSTSPETASAQPEATDAGQPAVAPSAEAAPAAAAPVEGEAASEQATTEQATADAEPAAEGSAGKSTAAEPATAEAPVEVATGGAPAPAAPDEFMRDLVAAMRQVAEEARQTGVAELRSRADEQVRKLEADADRRREDLRSRAEADVTGVGEWAKAEAERIKAEAEQRVVARRAQLEQQLAGDQARTEAETKALRDRVAEYERELEAYHAQLAEISDPAAFAAAAKRMPKPPALSATASAAPATMAEAATVDAQAPVEPATGPSNGVAASSSEVHPAEEEVLAVRLAQLDAALPEKEAAVAAAPSEPVTTEVVVKGLGSFGAITGFRQSLAGVEGIDGVALSLGQTGEFVFRATHQAGFDVRSAITTLEGDGAKIEDRSEGGLRVTLDRAR